MRLESLSVLSQVVTISRQQIVVIVICISLIPEVVLRIAVHHIPINHQAAVLQVVITINRHQAAIHHRTIAVQRKVLLEQAVQRKAIHITHMMMAMMIYIWMAIMIMIGMTGIVIMLMVLMMQWMSTEKISKADRAYEKKTTMEELYFTIAGCSYYFGSDFMEKGMKVKLGKELDNEYDKEAIQVKVKGPGKMAFVVDGGFVCRITTMGIDYTTDNENVRKYPICL